MHALTHIHLCVVDMHPFLNSPKHARAHFRTYMHITGTAFLLNNVQEASAIQGLTAGRIPGLGEVDADGFRTYTRPAGKSGGHGVGWSEIPQYSFKVRDGWDEIPVSIADLGGTEIDLRYQSKVQGDIAVVVAPVLRFREDVGFNARIKIEDLGSPEKMIKGFAPEIFGKPVEDQDIIATSVDQRRGLTFYNFEVFPHYLVSMTAFKNRVFILTSSCNGRQWKKAEADLRVTQKSFTIDPNTGE